MEEKNVILQRSGLFINIDNERVTQMMHSKRSPESTANNFNGMRSATDRLIQNFVHF